MKTILIALMLFLIWLWITIIALGFYFPFVVNSISTDNNFTIFGSNILMIVFISFIWILLLKLMYITFLVWRDFTVSHMVWFTNRNKMIKKQTEIFCKNFSVKNSFYFYKYLYFIIIKNSKVSDEELVLLWLPNNIKKKWEYLNTVLGRNVWKENFISHIEYEEWKFFLISISKGKLTSEELTKKILTIQDEIIKIFTWKNFSPAMIVENKKLDDFKISLHNSLSIWENKNISLWSIHLEKGQLLCGFYSQIGKWVEYFDYKIFSKNLYHSFIVWATRSGKDVFLLNLIFSILWNIKNFENMKLHFFDTKWNDGVYLENMRYKWVYRHSDISLYAKTFSQFVSEMRETQKMIWEYSNIFKYNEFHKERPIKEKIIIVNEFLSLTKRLSGKELNEFLGNVVSLTSEWAWTGIKLILMSQTIRKDSNPMLAEILLNIKTKFILKALNREEILINTRGLSENEISQIEHMKQNNCFHVEDNVIIREFKSYFLSQMEVKTWMEENFLEKNLQEIEKNFSQKMQDYYNFAKQNNYISLKEAMNRFDFSRTDWNKFIALLEKRWEIQRLPNNSIVWNEEKSDESL